METSQSLLDRLRCAPDPESWNRLVTLYTPWVRTIVQYGGVRPSDQDDLQQEVFAVLARELPKFDHNGRPGVELGSAPPTRAIRIAACGLSGRRRQFLVACSSFEQ